jgi:hypothetical protein
MASLRLIVLTNPVEGQEDEYNAWYSGPHLRDVLAIDGFTAAQRFEFKPTSTLGPEAPYRYMAIYEAEGMTAEEAETRLLETAADKNLMPISKAMAPERSTWFFEAITDRLEKTADNSAGVAGG